MFSSVLKLFSSLIRYNCALTCAAATYLEHVEAVTDSIQGLNCIRQDVYIGNSRGSYWFSLFLAIGLSGDPTFWESSASASMYAARTQHERGMVYEWRGCRFMRQSRGRVNGVGAGEIINADASIHSIDGLIQTAGRHFKR